MSDLEFSAKATAAHILRTLVTTIFNVAPHKIILSGEIAPDKEWQDNFSNGSLYDTDYTVKVWGFSPKTGFIELKDISGHYENNANGSRVDRPGIPLNEHPQVKENEFVFFYVEERGGYEDNNRKEDWSKDSIFKAPDFKTYWEKIEKEDIARWENWLT